MISITELSHIMLPRAWVFSVLAALTFLVAFFYSVLPLLSLRSRCRRNEITVMVLGDLGHSPRICYHALSLAEAGLQVNLCGYTESELSERIAENERIDIFPIASIKNFNNLPFILFAAYKVFIQLHQLFTLLFLVQGSKYYMIQNPPSIPLLLILIIFIKLFSPKSKLVIDWHNLNFTILNMKFNNINHPLVRALRLYEKHLARFAAVNITVTNQMKDFLVLEFQLDPSTIVPFHDRPGTQFQPLTDVRTKLELLATHKIFAGIQNIERYKIIVSATSFTPDEDFGTLLRALKLYDDDPEQQTRIFTLVTGKGPLQNEFLDTVERLQFLNKVVVRNAWLSTDDYPLLLSCADLAVSLHMSLSGIDLPMKIVDFFGVGVPVITLRFPAIGELVIDGQNGLVVPGIQTEHQEMYESLSRVLKDEKLLKVLKQGALSESEQRWDKNWALVLNPVLCD